MTKKIVRFVLVCEGTSDEALVAHLQRLLIHCGAAGAAGTSVALSSVPRSDTEPASALGDKIKTLLTNGSSFDLWFIHRDADDGNYTGRVSEIEEGARQAELKTDWVPLIPVRETEAWLLLDEAAIRRAAGSPKGRRPLNLPRPSQVEAVSDPKKALEVALCTASDFQGQRLKRFRRRLGDARRILLEQLPIGGQLEEVPAWQRLNNAVLHFLNTPAN